MIEDGFDIVESEKKNFGEKHEQGAMPSLPTICLGALLVPIELAYFKALHPCD